MLNVFMWIAILDCTSILQASNSSSTRLLSGYDRNLRPNFGEYALAVMVQILRATITMEHSNKAYLTSVIAHVQGQCLGTNKFHSILQQTRPPIIVEIDFNVRSMGPISEVDMTFSMDCYFRQTWIDKRLEFKGAIQTMTLGISTLERLWKPDTYFLNGRHSYLHTITVPNRLVRIDQNGRVLYSQRLTVKASCPMNLANFPIDTQQCPLELGSFAYSTQDVIYRWNSLRRVVIAADMKMSQFDLISSPSSNKTTILGNAKYSTLSVSFYLQRHTGYFLIQVYAPCMLLVVLSWVAFWINREATADRVALGVTTILTMTFLGLDSRNDLPKVSYSTALDSFMGISFAFVFFTIVQFALVHYFTKRGSGEVYAMSSDSDDDETDRETEDTGVTNNTIKQYADDVNVVFLTAGDTIPGGRKRSPRQTIFCEESDRGYFSYHRCPKCNRSYRLVAGSHTTFDLRQRRHPLTSSHYNDASDEGDHIQVLRKWLQPVICCLRTVGLFRRQLGYSGRGSSDEIDMEAMNTEQRQSRLLHRGTRVAPPASVQSTFTKLHHKLRHVIDLEEFNSVSKIDSISRIMFPASFIVINLTYWYIYLSQNTPYTR